MELWLPEQIALDDTSNALIKDVGETARRVNEYRPLPRAIVKRLEDELLGERVYSSNAIEGNTLDFRETVMILKHGVLDIKRKREALEARNLGDAARKIAEWVAAKEACHTGERLREVHGIILRDIDDQWAGRYREHSVLIEAAPHQPPDHTLVPSMVDRCMEKLGQSEDVHKVLLAVWTHWAIARIHPFHDGNGRIARLWQDLVLCQGGLTCAIIRPEDRRQYLDALGQADEGDFNPLVQLVARRIATTFDRYLAEVGKEEQFARFIEELAGEAGARIEESRRLSYLRWFRKMEQLRWEFELCASRISDASSDVKVQVRSLEIIEQPRWENIRSGRLGGPTGFFVVDFFCRGRRWRYFFFFGKHYWSEDLDNERERAENRVCLLASEDDGSGKEARRLDQMDDFSITLREVFVVDDSFVRKRVDPATGKLEYDRGVSPLQIAQDFMRDVILHRLS